MEEGRNEKRAKWKGQEASLAGMVAAFSLLAFFCYFIFFAFRGYVIGEPQSWGDFGSYFGGVVGPVIGIVTVVLVVRTLEATRDEADMTRKEMKAQREHFENQQVLAELQKRLDGTLAAWNQQMLLKRPGLREYLLGQHGSKDETVGEILNHPGTIPLIQELKENHPSWRNLIYQNWGSFLNEEINLLQEMGRYCADYDEKAKSKLLTNFYRLRVNLPLRAFVAVEILPVGTEQLLSVGRYQVAAASVGLQVG